jgi:hypothetical protein
MLGQPMSKLDDLRWVRVFTPVHIPKYLVEQIKHRDYSSDEFYQYQELICLRETSEGPTLNPFSHLYVLASGDNITKGFLWLEIDPLTKDLIIQAYSVDKEYWGGGGAIGKLADLVKEIRDKGQLKKIYWITDYPKHSKRHGFRISKSVLMEYSEEEDGQICNGIRQARGEHQHADARTEEIPVGHVG